MSLDNLLDHGVLVRTPWDSKVFAIDTFEVRSFDEETLKVVANLPGHFTIKVDPSRSTDLLHRCGFYYCDTLVEPFCRRQHFIAHDDPDVRVVDTYDIGDFLSLSRGAYTHGRFHRDPNIPSELADARYDSWLRQIHAAGGMIGLAYRGTLAAYFARENAKVLLHAVHVSLRGKGLAKYLWTAGYNTLFREGFDEVSSSVSASNMPVTNLYCSLGFKFRSPLDVYHLFNPSG
jgi:ribosomal protein S18 acetylase RimI-like enzyme